MTYYNAWRTFVGPPWYDMFTPSPETALSILVTLIYFGLMFMWSKEFRKLLGI